MLFLFSEIENCGSGQTSYEREDYSSRSGDRYFVFADELPGLVAEVRRACEHRLVFEVPLDVQTERIGGRITAGAIFLQRLHDDPVQIATNQSGKLRALSLAMPGDIGAHFQWHCLHKSRRLLWLLVADRAADFIKALSHQILRIEGSATGKQLVEQNAE